METHYAGKQILLYGKHSGQLFLTSRRTDRRLLKILIARVEFFSLRLNEKTEHKKKIELRNCKTTDFATPKDILWIEMIHCFFVGFGEQCNSFQT